MKAAAAIVALMLAGTLAGCIGDGTAGITAKEAASRASDRARQWDANAQLTQLGTWETRSATGLAQRDIGFAPPIDTNVGDGRAQVWLTGFASPDGNRTLQLIVFSNGTMLAEEGRGKHDTAQIRNWEIDSPGMADAAKGHPDVAAILAAPDASMASFLHAPDTNVSDPVWGFVAVSPSLQRMAQGAVGARRGDVIAVHVQNFTSGSSGNQPIRPPPVSYDFQGAVDPATPKAEHPFDVVQGHALIHVQFNANPRFPGLDGARLRILDPQGNELSGSPGGGQPFVADNYVVTTSGTYTAEVTFTTQAPATAPVPGLQTVDYTLKVQVE